MSWVRNVTVVVGAAVGTVLLGGLFLSADYVVARTAVIHAPADTVYAQIADLKRTELWMPFKKEDPSMVYTFGDVTVGKGARYTWTSEKMGDGVYTIVDEDVGQRVVVLLEFSGWGNSAESSFDITANGDETEVVWVTRGTEGMPIFGPYVALLMDSMMGPMFEAGLKDLEVVAQQAERDAEVAAKKAAADRGQADAARAAAQAAAVREAAAAIGASTPAVATPPPTPPIGPSPN